MNSDTQPIRSVTQPRYFLLFLLLRIATAEHNRVIGEPFVNCAADAIYIKLRTNLTFEGHVNVRFTPNRYCYQVLVTNNQIEVLVPHEECAVPRRRSLEPTGILLDTTLSVSFHPQFTTVDDQLFHFSCLHLSKPKGQLDIGKTVTQAPSVESNGISCSYSVLSSSDGVPVGRVRLGQIVFHEWKCQNVQKHCLVVRNCFLAASESKYELIGKDGCSRDINVLPQLSYINQSYVGQNVSVFGVSRTSLVYFQCEILLIPSTSSCQTPHCTSGNRTKRDESLAGTILEIQSQKIEISELDELVGISNDEESSEEHITVTTEIRSNSGEICLENYWIMAIVIVMISLMMTTFGMFISIIGRYRFFKLSQSA